MKRRIILTLLVAALVIVPAAVSAQENDDLGVDLGALTLQDAVNLALSKGESAEIAQEEIKKAKGAVTEYRGAAWPQLTGIAGYTYNLEEPTNKMDFSFLDPLSMQAGGPPIGEIEIPLVYRHDWKFTLNARQNLFTFGRVGNAIRMAKTYRSISEENAELTNQDTVLEAAEAYYGVVLAKEMADVARKNFKISKMHLDDVQAKFDRGLKSEFELLQAKADLEQSRPYLIKMDSMVVITKLNLLRLMGMNLDLAVDVGEGFSEETLKQSVNDYVLTAQSDRKELNLLNMQKDMNHLEGNIHRSGMLPILAAEMNYTYAGQSISDEDDFWPQGDDDWMTFWSVGATMTWPFFDGFTSVGKMRQARATERITRLRRTQAVKGIELEVTQLATRLETLKQELAARKESVALVNRAFELASIRYDSGLGTRLEKVDAKAQWTLARSTLIQTLYDLNIARVKLNRALGKGQ